MHSEFPNGNSKGISNSVKRQTGVTSTHRKYHTLNLCTFRVAANGTTTRIHVGVLRQSTQCSNLLSKLCYSAYLSTQKLYAVILRR